MTDLEYLKKYYEDDINEALKKLESGLPVQYIVGNVDFYNINLLVNKDVLIPRFETEELVDKTIDYIKKYFNYRVNIIDLGTGSGCIAIALKKNINCDIKAIDISDKALTLAKKNALKNNCDINFIKHDMIVPLKDKYDIIISNPPYIRYDEEIMDIVKNNEPNIALYAKDKGLYFYKQIIKNYKDCLNDKSLLAFEIGLNQDVFLKEYAHKYFPNSKIIIEKDLTGINRFMFILNNI